MKRFFSLLPLYFLTFIWSSVSLPYKVVHDHLDFIDIKLSYTKFESFNTSLLSTNITANNVTFVFFHNYGSSSKTWNGTMHSLAEKGYSSVAVDLPGFGETKSLPYNDNNLRALLVSTLVTSLGANRTILVSQSSASKYTIPFLDRYGTQVWGYVGIAPLKIRDWGGPWEDTHIKVRLLAMTGDKDPEIADIDYLMKLFRHTTKVIIPDAKKTPHLENPALFKAKLLNFAEHIISIKA